MNVNDYIYSPYVLFNIPCLYVACWTNNFIVLLKPHGMKELKIIKLYFCFTVFKYSLILYNIFISVLYEKIMLLYTARKESLSEVWHLIQNGKFWIGNYLSEHFTNYIFVFIINTSYLISQNLSYQYFLLLKPNIQMSSAFRQGNIHIMAHKNSKTVEYKSCSWNWHHLLLYNTVHSHHDNISRAGNQMCRVTSLILWFFSVSL